MTGSDRFGFADSTEEGPARHNEELPWLQSASREDDDSNEPFIPRGWVVGLAVMFLVAFVAVAGIVYRMAQDRAKPPSIHINQVARDNEKAPAATKPEPTPEKSSEHPANTATADEDLQVTGSDTLPVLAQTVVNNSPNAASAPREAGARPAEAPKAGPEPVSTPTPTPAPAPAPKAITPPPATAPAPVPTPKPKAVVPTLAATPIPAPAPKPKAVTPPPGIYVQLGAFSSQARAQAAWGMFSSKHDALHGHDPVILSAGAAFRLRTGPLASRAEADQLCASLKAEGQSCIIAQ